MKAFERATKQVVGEMCGAFKFNINWLIDGGKTICIKKFKTIRYTYGLYFAYDCHRGKKGDLCRYSENEPKEWYEFVLFGVGDISLEAKKLKNPVLKTEEFTDHIVYVKDKKVQFVK